MSDSTSGRAYQADPPTGSACLGVSSPKPLNKRPFCVRSSLAQEVGRALREARLSMGLTQGEAADAMGISQPTMCRIELGKEEVTLGMLQERVSGMGLDVVLTFRRRAVVR